MKRSTQQLKFDISSRGHGFSEIKGYLCLGVFRAAATILFLID